MSSSAAAGGAHNSSAAASAAAIDLQEIKVDAHQKLDVIPLSDQKSTKAVDKYWLDSVEDFAKRHKTSINAEQPKSSAGLTSAEAASRLLTYGPNAFTTKAGKPEWLKYLLQYTDPFMIMLLLAGVLSLVAYSLDTTQPINMYLGILLFGVTFLSCTFAYFQEGKATSAMSGFQNMLPRSARVIRDGREIEIPAIDLVPGDVIRVVIGDQIPADARCFWVNDLKVEMSSLTGEPNALSRKVISEEDRDIEASNLIFNTSQCMEGEGYAIVYGTGDNTLIGRIANLASGTKEGQTPLQIEVSLFVKKIATLAFSLCIIFFVIGMARGAAFISTFISAIIVAIACVPEGLPMTVVSALSITAKRMADKHCFIKQLSSVETLGSVNLICSDKTGTLTQNKMCVANFWFDLYSFPADAVKRDLPPARLRPKKGDATPTFAFMEATMGVCNRTRFEDQRDLTPAEVADLEIFNNLDPLMTASTLRAKMNIRLTDDSRRKVVDGDASEQAMFNFVVSRQSVELMRFNYKVEFDLPFNSKNKFSLAIVSWYDTGLQRMRRMVLLKGAPERVLARCNSYIYRGESKPKDERFSEAFNSAYERFGSLGERVIGFASLELDAQNKVVYTSDNWPQDGYSYLGLVTLKDPPKESVPPAIKTLKQAGLRIFMVTGDHHLTGAAIARQVGIISEESVTVQDLMVQYGKTEEQIWDEHAHEIDAVVVTGAQIEHYVERDWNRILGKKEVVFARTSPEQKLEIVKNAQRLGNVVAVTGDGVNDSPSLKQADIGIAMGHTGSDVSRDAAHVILMNDDFSSIVLGVEEGRTIFDNLAKTIAYTITHMLPEVAAVLLNLAFGFPLALNSIMILCIDLGTEVAPAVSFAYETAEADVMKRKPRNAKHDRLVTLKMMGYLFFAGAVQTAFAFMGFFLVFKNYGISSSSLAFTDKYWLSTSPVLHVDGKTFTADQQVEMVSEAQTCYWVILVGCQVFHAFICKTRVLSVFDHGLFNNMVMNYGVVLEIFLAVFIVFVPWSQPFFGTKGFQPSYQWAFILIPATILLLRAEITKYFTRQDKEGVAATYLNW